MLAITPDFIILSLEPEEYTSSNTLEIVFLSNSIFNNIYKDTKSYDAKDKNAVDPRYWIHQISKVFEWFNCVAYSTLAALLGRMIIFPAGVLAESDLLIRIFVLVLCILVFIFSKKNLVIPTILSAILLSFFNFFIFFIISFLK